MNKEHLMKILLSPRISEKSSSLEAKNQYVFNVKKDADKREIADAVKYMFNVDVIDVRTCTVRGKIKSFKGRVGKRSAGKKAYVTIKTGQTINFGGA